MADYIEKEALIKEIQDDYKFKEEIYKEFYSKCYRGGIEDEFESVISIIENMPYLVKGELCTTLEEGEKKT